MLFNSLPFLVFFPTVVVGYFLLPHALRWCWLLAASYLFYGYWNPSYLLLILFSTAVDYLAARRMEGARDRPVRRRWLAVSLLSNIGLLVAFKYLGFLHRALGDAVGLVGVQLRPMELDFLLPVGISFYTFQTLGYSIDVYRGHIPAERHFGRFALYVSFFPQLVAGPIERAQRLLPQFRERHRPVVDRIGSGLLLMLWGFFKKVVVADRLAIYVDAVYNNVDSYTGFPLVWATLFFAFQIYCDFSGYTDIAIGAARVLGFDLMENFRRPYLARSVREFWSRWHISLSTWFRDYVYIPLGGNRVSDMRWYLNLMIVFIVSGLWHGAAWTFLAWGAVHGALIVAEVAPGARRTSGTASARGSLPPAARTGLTFFLVTLTWILFRANSLPDAGYVFTHLHLLDPAYLIGVPTVTRGAFVLMASWIGIVVVSDLFLEHGWERRLPGRTRVDYPLLFAYGLLMAIYLFGVFEEQAFIYFQF